MSLPTDNSDDLTGDERAGALKARAPDDPWKIEPLSEALMDDPIEFIFADHLRQRQAAIILTMVAAGEFNTVGVKNLVDFLKEDFALHIADEELGFFPLLREQCLAEDKIEPLIARLIDEHKGDESLGDEVIELLEALLKGEKLASGAAAKLSSFAEHILQHLAVENAVLLPIARVRMNNASLDALSGMLKARRAPKR